MDLRTHLVKFQIFHGLKEDQFEKFFSALKIRTYKAEDIVFKEGEVGDSIYLLLEGMVEINKALTLQLSKGSYDTREKSIISLSSDKYPSFGELSLLTHDDKRTATVKALTDCKMAVVMKDDFFFICESDHEIGYQVMRNIAAIVSKHLSETNKNVLKLTTAFSLVLQK